MRKTLSNIGSSLGIILEKPLLEALGITKNSILDLSIEGGAIVIRSAPQRNASSRDEFEDWAKSLLVRLASAGADAAASDDLATELVRFEETLPVFLPKLHRKAPTRHARSWLQEVVEHLASNKPPPAKPIFTRMVALAVLEELSDARGTFREITAARPFANATPDVVASVLWFLIARGFVEVHPESSSIRPAVERFKSHGRIPETLPDSLAESLKRGVVLIRLTPAGGEYLHELRATEAETTRTSDCKRR